MTDENNHPLVPYRASAIEKDSAGARGILSTIVSDALVLAQKNSLANTRFRIGDHYLREPDFRQIQRWAEALELEPAEVIRRLEEKGSRTRYENRVVHWWRERDFDADTRFEDGAIVSLAWNFDLLPLAEFTWEDDLHIQRAFFLRKMPVGAHLFINLPTLTVLTCQGLGGGKLDLHHLHNLVILECLASELSDIDLSNAPNLIVLECANNELTELNLSHVPKLTHLNCQDNENLTEIDLSCVPALTALGCYNNSFTQLDLSHVPNLTELDCSFNKLTALDLSQVPDLNYLNCTSNMLPELDLSLVPKLVQLACTDNNLTDLDLSTVPELAVLDCSYNQLTKLNLSDVPKLAELDCTKNKLTNLDIRPLKNLRAFNHDPFVSVTKSPDQQYEPKHYLFDEGTPTSYDKNGQHLLDTA